MLGFLISAADNPSVSQSFAQSRGEGPSSPGWKHESKGVSGVKVKVLPAAPNASGALWKATSLSKYMAGCDLEDTFYWPIVDCQSLLSYWRRILDIYQSTWPSDHSTFNIQHFMFKYPAYSHRQAVGRVTITRDASGVDTLFVLTTTILLSAHSVQYKTHLKLQNHLQHVSAIPNSKSIIWLKMRICVHCHW